MSAEPMVVGIDVSLTHTGIAHLDGTTSVVRPGSTGMQRIAHIRSEVMDAVTQGHTELVVIEGYSYGSKGRAIVSLGELGGVLRFELWRTGTPFVEVPPATVKKFATGSGNANKFEVIAAAHTRLGYTRFDDNEADALWLRAIGCDLLGVPLCRVPKVQAHAIDPLRKVQPELCNAEMLAVDVPTGGLL